ncbi:MAG: IMPACT family protein [Bacteroidota bacterium]
MKTGFKSLAKQSEFLYKEKGSRFIGFAQKCSSEAEIKAVLAELHMKHPQATHICYAWKIGVNKVSFRANDDGEPNNSAGAPILGQINSFGLTNVLVAVIRYYGGTKLGVGGLIMAYKAAAREAIEANEITAEELSCELELHMSYEAYPVFMKFMKQHNLRLLSQEQTESVTLRVEIKNAVFEAVKAQLTDIKELEIRTEKLNL